VCCRRLTILYDVFRCLVKREVATGPNRTSAPFRPAVLSLRALSVFARRTEQGHGTVTSNRPFQFVLIRTCLDFCLFYFRSTPIAYQNETVIKELGHATFSSQEKSLRERGQIYLFTVRGTNGVASKLESSELSNSLSLSQCQVQYCTVLH